MAEGEALLEMRSANCSASSKRGLWDARAGEFGAEYKAGSFMPTADSVAGGTPGLKGDGGGESKDAMFFGGPQAGGDISIFELCGITGSEELYRVAVSAGETKLSNGIDSGGETIGFL